MSSIIRIFRGPMFSGKSARLIRAIEDARPYFPGGVVVMKHKIDAPRHGTDSLVSRAGLRLEGVRLADDEVLESEDQFRVGSGMLYAVDEAHFFSEEALVSLWKRVRAKEKTGLFLAGLDRDFRASEWGSVCSLSRRMLDDIHSPAVEVIRTASKCSRVVDGKTCNEAASLTQRLEISSTSEDTVLVGDSETYQPACPSCHSPKPISHTHWFQQSPDR